LKRESAISPENILAIAEQLATVLMPMMGRLETSKQVKGLIGMAESASRGEGQQDRPRTLPEVRYIRLKEILEIIPVSKSTWYKGIAEGRYPKPTKRFGPRIAAWDIRDIRALLDNKVE
jgi:predicted DNA-binding transcriptional regulator AlpA